MKFVSQDYSITCLREFQPVFPPFGFQKSAQSIVHNLSKKFLQKITIFPCDVLYHLLDSRETTFFVVSLFFMPKKGKLSQK